jgi:hypothetical protein
MHTRCFPRDALDDREPQYAAVEPGQRERHAGSSGPRGMLQDTCSVPYACIAIMSRNVRVQASCRNKRVVCCNSVSHAPCTQGMMCMPTPAHVYCILAFGTAKHSRTWTKWQSVGRPTYALMRYLFENRFCTRVSYARISSTCISSDTLMYCTICVCMHVHTFTGAYEGQLEGASDSNDTDQAPTHEFAPRRAK